MGRVVHFEITAEDTGRAIKFYKIFGWQFNDAGVEGMEYLLAKTGTDSIGIDGAIMPRTYRQQPVIPWIAVDDLEDMIEKVHQAGGQTAGDRQHVPNVGETIYITDTEGNTIGLIEAIPPQQQADAPGA